MPGIGMDLGTTNSCVAFHRNGMVTVIQNDQQERTVPSCVAFTPVERFIGDVAKCQMKNNPKNTIYGVKRLLGRSYREVKQLKDEERLPFKLEDDNGKPKIEVQYRKQSISLYPEEITATILSHMKDIASTKTDVSGAVITVPASFNSAQRKATIDAAKIARIEVLGLLNETTAIALAYRIRDSKQFSSRKALVLHMGVGTFDVSVITIDGSTLKVESSVGNSHLGGENVTQWLSRHLAEDDLITDPASATNLRIACEKLKVGLSDKETTSATVVANGKRKQLRIGRTDFNKITQQFQLQIRASIGGAMAAAQLANHQIDDVLVTGGNGGMAMIMEIITVMGLHKKIRSVDAVEDAARGAAAYAAIISKEKGFRWKDLTILESFSHTLIVLNTKIHEGGRGIPHTERVRARLGKGSTRTEIINEESVVMVERNGRFCKPLHYPIGSIQFTTTVGQDASIDLKIDGSGLLSASSAIPETKIDVAIGLTDEKIKCLAERAAQFRADDDRRKTVMQAMYELEDEAMKTQSSIDSLIETCKKIGEWARQTSDPSINEVTSKKRELSSHISRIREQNKKYLITQAKDERQRNATISSVSKTERAFQTTEPYAIILEKLRGFSTLLGIPIPEHTTEYDNLQVEKAAVNRNAAMARLKHVNETPATRSQALETQELLDTCVAETSQKLEQLEKSVKQFKSAMEEKDREITQTKEECMKFQETNEQLKQRNSETSVAKLQLQEMEKSVKQFKSAMEEKDREITRTKEECIKFQKTVKLLNGDMEEKDREIMRTTGECMKFQETIKRLEDAIEEKDLEIQKGKDELSKFQSKQDRRDNEKLRSLNASYEHNLREKDRQIETLTHDLSKSKQDRIDNEELRSLNASYARSLREKVRQIETLTHDLSKGARSTSARGFSQTSLPARVTHTLKSRKLKIDWKAPSYASEYWIKVVRKPELRVTSENVNNFQLTLDTQPLTTYKYQVSAKNYEGCFILKGTGAVRTSRLPWR